MIHTTLPSTSNDVSKSGQIEDIIHFLFDMIKDELTALDDPRFSFYRYVDQKLNTPLLSAVALGAEPLFLNLSGLKSDSAQSPASTPKFISSEDNTQTKTNYYTEPSIGMLSPPPKKGRDCDGPPDEPFNEPFAGADGPDASNAPSEDDHTFEVPVVSGSIFQDCDKSAPPPSAEPAQQRPGVMSPAVLPQPERRPVLPEPMQEVSVVAAVPPSLSQTSPPISQPHQIVLAVSTNPSARSSPKWTAPSQSQSKPVYYLEAVEHRDRSSGVYIYVTTEGKEAAAARQDTEQSQLTRVSIPLPIKDLAGRREKTRKLALRTQEVQREVENDRKYVKFCTKVIKQLNNTTRGNVKDIINVIIYAARLMPKLFEESRSRILREYGKSLAQILVQYLSTLSATVIGDEILRHIFRRCALLIKLEQLAEQSAGNLDFISANLDSAVHRPELNQRLEQEQRRTRTEQKLRGVSKQIAEQLKVFKCEERHRSAIEMWCRTRPVEDPVTDVWKFLDRIKDIVPDLVPTV